MANLKEIYSKLKTLTGPDRRIDAELDVLVKGSDWVVMSTHSGYVMGLVEGTRYQQAAPRYTGSVDDALSFVDRMISGHGVSNWNIEMKSTRGGFSGASISNGNEEKGINLPIAILLSAIMVWNLRIQDQKLTKYI